MSALITHSPVVQGYGDTKPKSSTTAQEVRTLDGVYIEQVNGCGGNYWTGAILLFYHMHTRTLVIDQIKQGQGFTSLDP